MQMLGTISRLQIQRSSLKIGPLQERRYVPEPLLAVPRVRLVQGGVQTEDGQLDVHHPLHPSGKNVGKNGVSVGFSAHYEAMRRRFGPHLTDGIAGENILVESAGPVSLEDLREGLVILAGDGREVRLSKIVVAEPCVEFTSYALQISSRDDHRPAAVPLPEGERERPEITRALNFLRMGRRGFYATFDGDPVEIRVGDRVLLR